jgi:hypothetical protein
MKINVIKTLDKGMSNISASGVVDYCKAAENKTGEFNGKPYSFWTQFIVLKDDTGDIGVNLNLGDSKINVAKGQEIQIEKGTLDSYVKDGKTFQTLKARLHSVQNPSQQASQPQQAKNAPKAVQTDDRNYSFALSYAKDMVCANSLKWIDFWPTVEAFQRYLETGKTPMVKDDEQSSEEDLPANIGEEPKQTLVDESGDEIPF